MNEMNNENPEIAETPVAETPKTEETVNIKGEIRKTVKRKGAVALAVILSVALSMASVTYAWFATVRQVAETGMGMALHVSSELVIAETAEAVAGDNVGRTITRTLPENKNPMLPCSHDFTLGLNSPTNLYYLGNIAQVDRKTGLLITGTSETITPLNLAVTEDDAKTFYVEYEAYIASTGSAIDATGTKLTATMSVTAKGSADKTSYLATSVDFYVVSGSTETYVGTLNQVGKDAEKNATDPTAVKTSLDVYTGTIPKNSDTPLHIMMRCYFDGALLQSAGQAYVNSETVSVENVTVIINFDVTSGS